MSNSALSSAGAQTRGATQLAINQALRAGQAAAVRCTRDFVEIRVRVRQAMRPPERTLHLTRASMKQVFEPRVQSPLAHACGQIKGVANSRGSTSCHKPKQQNFPPCGIRRRPPKPGLRPSISFSSSSLQTGRTGCDLVRETTPKSGSLPLLVGVATADELAVCPAVDPLADHELVVRRGHAHAAVAAVGLALDADLRARARSSPVATRPGLGLGRV